jgi:hypothetical protein
MNQSIKQLLPWALVLVLCLVSSYLVFFPDDTEIKRLRENLNEELKTSKSLRKNLEESKKKNLDLAEYYKTREDSSAKAFAANDSLWRIKDAEHEKNFNANRNLGRDTLLELLSARHGERPETINR